MTIDNFSPDNHWSFNNADVVHSGKLTITPGPDCNSVCTSSIHDDGTQWMDTIDPACPLHGQYAHIRRPQ